MKKGISPLIATMILIVLAVSIGAIVFSWSKGYVKDTTNSVSENFENKFKCDLNPGLRITTLNSSKLICYNETMKAINFTVENGPDMDVKQLFVRVIDIYGNTAAGFIPGTAMPRAGATRASFNYSDIDIPAQVKIIPVLVINGKETVCTKAAVVEEELYPCK